MTSSTLHAVDASVSICGLSDPDEAEEIRNLIDVALAGYEPTVTITVSEYPKALPGAAAEGDGS
ncbi:hypothetical protein ACFCYB_34005 [Streptomyces sp. NPDC056309]|uniref:hypothetical protein n=1 Tax=unclassified Streptomyces TaxID=2593676 RepID=UPI0035DA61FB